jgi:hypothetical protein
MVRTMRANEPALVRFKEHRFCTMPPLKLEMWASVATTLEDDAAVELTAVMSNFMSLPPKAMPGQVRFSVCGSAGDIASALLQAGALRPSRFPSSSRMHGM